MVNICVNKAVVDINERLLYTNDCSHKKMGMDD